MELDTVLSTGVAAALQMAVKKGFVEKDGKNRKRDGSSKTIIEGVGIRDWLDKSVCLSVCQCTQTTLYIYIYIMLLILGNTREIEEGRETETSNKTHNKLIM